MYCDDFVVCCESENDAKAFLNQLQERFKKFGLSIAEDKTQIIKFGKREWYLAEKQNRKVSTFNFLGFTHYGKKSRKGKWIMCHKTSKSNMARKLKEIKEYLKEVRNRVLLKEWWPTLILNVKGHLNYFGISGNYYCLEQFKNSVLHLAFKWINRRSQKKSMSWERYLRFLDIIHCQNQG